MVSTRGKALKEKTHMDPIHRTHDIERDFRKVHSLHYTLARIPVAPSHLHSIAHSYIITLMLRKREGVRRVFDTEVTWFHPDHNIIYHLSVTTCGLVRQVH